MIFIWCLLSGKIVKILNGHTSMIYSLVLNFHDKYILSGSFDKTIKIWRNSTGKTVKTLRDHFREVYCITSDNKYDIFLVSGCSNCTIKIWNIRKGK